MINQGIQGYGGFHKWGYHQIDGLFHGKSDKNMNYLEKKHFRKPPYHFFQTNPNGGENHICRAMFCLSADDLHSRFFHT